MLNHSLQTICDGDKKKRCQRENTNHQNYYLQSMYYYVHSELQAGCFTNCLQQYFPSIKKNSLLEQLQFEYKLQLSI